MIVVALKIILLIVAIGATGFAVFAGVRAFVSHALAPERRVAQWAAWVCVGAWLLFVIVAIGW